MFGQTNHPFGQSSTSPFTSQFGQTNTATSNPFAPKPFGSTTPFGSQTGGSIFGGMSTGVFGAAQSSLPAFGSSMPSFGAASTPAFGSSSSSFGGVFGAAQSSSPFDSTAFGASSSPAFGSSMPSFGAASTPAFGSSSSSFGDLLYMGKSLLLEALGLPQLSQVHLEAHFNHHNQRLGQLHLLTGQINPHLVPLATLIFVQQALLRLALQDPQPLVLQALPPLVPQQAHHLGAWGVHLVYQVPRYFDLEYLGLLAGASSAPAFGASSTSAFGAPSNPAFGSSSTPSFSFGSSPAFGQSSSAFGSSPFGTTTSPFGAQSSAFGAQATTPTFGNVPFGQSAFGSQRGGSRVTPYTPTTEVDGALESISVMPFYKEKSHEELRWEDYKLGDKGGPNPAGQSTSGIGFSTSTAQSSPFQSSSTFGQSSSNPFSTSTPSNPFGPSTSAFGTSSTPMFSVLPFGSTSSASSSLFATSTLGFGSNPSPSFLGTSSSSAFGPSPSIFGSISAQETAPAFSTGLSFRNTQSSPLFQSTAPSFGQTTTPFGQTTSAFGQNTTTPFTQSNIFNTPLTGIGGNLFFSIPSLLPSSNPGGFSQTTTSLSTPFQSAQPAQTSSEFGFGTFGQTQAAWAQATTPTFGNAPFGQSAFGGQCGGSRVSPYTPTTEVDGADDTQPAGKLESISAMPVYKEKSHEELRWVDYELGDKGALNPVGQCTSVIGFSTSTPQSSPFPSSSAFGQSSLNPFSTSTPSNPFGPSTSTFGTPSTPTFSVSPAPSTTNPFGSTSSALPSLFATSTPGFGSNSSPSIFGTSSSSAFGPSLSIFGSISAQETAPAFSTGLSFRNTQSSPLFQSTAPSFGQTTSAFGQTTSASG